MEEVSNFSLLQSESSMTGRMSPWIERISREPAGIAANRSEIGSVLPKRSVHLERMSSCNPPPIKHLRDLPDAMRNSYRPKEASWHSPRNHQYRLRNPVMKKSYMDLSPVVTYPGENVEREQPLAARAKRNTAIFSADSMLKMMPQPDNSSIERSVVNNVSNQTEVVRWLDRIGPGVKSPAYSKLTESSTGHNTGTSSGVDSANEPIYSIGSYASHTASGLAKNLERPSFGYSEVTPFSSRIDILPTSLESATTRDGSCGDYIVPSLGDVCSSKADVKLNKDVLLSCPAATASELFQEKCDLAYLADPIKDEHATDSNNEQATDSNTPDCRAANPAQRHPAELTQTGGHKSAIPRLKSIYYHQTLKQSHSSGAAKHNAPDTKLLSLVIGHTVSSQARFILPPQDRQQTVKEYIDRRRGPKENVSSKGLEQVRVDIDRPDSGLEETLLVYQAWMRTGRGSGKSSAGILSPNSDHAGRSTGSKLDHVDGCAPRSGSGRNTNHGQHLCQRRPKCDAESVWSSTDANNDFVKVERIRLCASDIRSHSGTQKRGSRTQLLFPASPQENRRNFHRRIHREQARNGAYVDMANGSSYVTSHVTCAGPKAPGNGTHGDRRRGRSNREGELHDSAAQRSQIPVMVNDRGSEKRSVGNNNGYKQGTTSSCSKSVNKKAANARHDDLASQRPIR